MFGKSTTRFVRRAFSASIVWTMIPLAALAGLPVASCACVKCECGTACKFALHSAVSCCYCCSNCPCAGTSHCCCMAKLAAASKQTCQHAPGKGFNSPDSKGCRTSVTAIAGIRATHVAVADGYQPLSMDIPAVAASSESTWLLTRTNSLNTGPPINLVITLQHLVI